VLMLYIYNMRFLGGQTVAWEVSMVPLTVTALVESLLNTFPALVHTLVCAFPGGSAINGEMEKVLPFRL